MLDGSSLFNSTAFTRRVTSGLVGLPPWSRSYQRKQSLGGVQVDNPVLLILERGIADVLHWHQIETFRSRKCWPQILITKAKEKMMHVSVELQFRNNPREGNCLGVIFKQFGVEQLFFCSTPNELQYPQTVSSKAVPLFQNLPFQFCFSILLPEIHLSWLSKETGLSLYDFRRWGHVQ